MADQTGSNQSRVRVPLAAVALLILGFVLLLNTTGIVSWGIWLHLFRFWPFILIAVGVNLLLSPRFPMLSVLAVAFILATGIGLAFLSNQTTETYDYQFGSESYHSSKLANVHTLEMNIGFGAGSLDIDSDLSQYGESLFAVHSRGINAAVTEARNNGLSEVALSVDAPDAFISDLDNGWDFNIDLVDLFRGLGDINWEVEISPDVAVRLDIDAGAAELDFDLTNINLETLDMDIGAADVEIALPASAGHTDVYIDAGAADIDITLPEGVAALIESDSALISLDVDTSRFPGNGGVYQTSDYAVAENRVYIRIDAGVSDISIN